MSLKNYRRLVDRHLRSLETEKLILLRSKKELNVARKEQKAGELGETILRRSIRLQQQQVTKKISGIVTHCLQDVFGIEYSFELRLQDNKKQTGVSFVFTHAGIEIDDPLGALGGGIIDVASFSLRLVWLLFNSRNRHLLVLDEPFRFVSREHQESIKRLLLEISETFQIQIVLVTHNDSYVLGSVCRL